MARYIHVAKHNVNAVIRGLTLQQQHNGIFHNIAVLPYRGKSLDPALYVTIKIG